MTESRYVSASGPFGGNRQIGSGSLTRWGCRPVPLAVIALAMSFLGIGFKAAVFALFVYSVLPIARNTLAGITAVPDWIIDAAKGMGMPNGRILYQIEIPNAMSVILTGLFFAVVFPIGLLRRALGKDPMRRKDWKQGKECLLSATLIAYLLTFSCSCRKMVPQLTNLYYILPQQLYYLVLL